MKTFALLTAILSGLSAPLAYASAYYIDPVGNDSASGTSAATPWQSLAKVNATTFLPGDNIYFKKGGVWTGSLWPKGSGSNTSQITLGAYGTGAKPLIDGAGGGPPFLYLPSRIGRLTDSRSPIRQAEPAATAAASASAVAAVATAARSTASAM